MPKFFLFFITGIITFLCITISLIKLFLFYLNPKLEWMGDYPKASNKKLA